MEVIVIVALRLAQDRLKRIVIVSCRKTTIIHLQQSHLGIAVTISHLTHHRLLSRRITQLKILISVLDNLHHLALCLFVVENLVTTHNVIYYFGFPLQIAVREGNNFAIFSLF